MTQSIAIFHPSRREDKTALAAMVTAAGKAGLAVELCAPLYESLESAGMTGEAIRANVPGPECVAVVSLGGDGTFLKAARWALSAPVPVPVAGVNAGRLGFLAAWERHEFPTLVAMIASGQIPTRRRTMLKVSSPHLSSAVWPLALNDISILRSHTSQMITVEANLNGSPLTRYTGDGLIVCTATGSTGYNLSAGGPILQPGTTDIVLTPVAPHTLTQRPLVLDGDSRLDMKVTGRARSFMLSIDGNSFTLPEGAQLTVERAPVTLSVIANPNEDFASRLRAKLMWGTNPVIR